MQHASESEVIELQSAKSPISAALKRHTTFLRQERLFHEQYTNYICHINELNYLLDARNVDAQLIMSIASEQRIWK